MCGRFTLTTKDYEAVARGLDAELAPGTEALLRPRYNIAPSDRHLVLCRGSRARVLEPALWGLPGKVRGQVHAHINARSETAATKATFRGPFVSGRCGVVADGFFEWTGTSGAKRPIWFHTPDREVFLFAGLYRELADPREQEVRRFFTILTSAANRTVAPYHHRMPVILAAHDTDLWLGPAPARREDLDDFRSSLASVLRPAPDGLLVATPVSRRVNDPRNDDPDCVREVSTPDQGSLDL